MLKLGSNSEPPNLVPKHILAIQRFGLLFWMTNVGPVDVHGEAIWTPWEFSQCQEQKVSRFQGTRWMDLFRRGTTPSRAED